MQNIFFIRKKYIYFLLLVISLLTSIVSESRVSEPLSPKGKARKIDFLTLEIILNRHYFNNFPYKTNNTTLLSSKGKARKIDFLTLEIALNRHYFNNFPYKTNNTTLLSPVGRVDFRSNATKRRERSYALKTFKAFILFYQK